MAEPQRIQLKRTKGWKLPEGAVNVARHSSGKGKWGNPFRIGHKVICPGRWGTEASPYKGDLPAGDYARGNGETYEIRLVRDRADAVALYIAYYSKTAWCEPAAIERIRRELGGWPAGARRASPATGTRSWRSPAAGGQARPMSASRTVQPACT